MNALLNKQGGSDAIAILVTYFDPRSLVALSATCKTFLNAIQDSSSCQLALLAHLHQNQSYGKCARHQTPAERITEVLRLEANISSLTPRSYRHFKLPPEVEVLGWQDGYLHLRKLTARDPIQSQYILDCREDNSGGSHTALGHALDGLEHKTGATLAFCPDNDLVVSSFFHTSSDDLRGIVDLEFLTLQSERTDSPLGFGRLVSGYRFHPEATRTQIRLTHPLEGGYLWDFQTSVEILGPNFIAVKLQYQMDSRLPDTRCTIYLVDWKASTPIRVWVDKLWISDRGVSRAVLLNDHTVALFRVYDDSFSDGEPQFRIHIHTWAHQEDLSLLDGEISMETCLRRHEIGTLELEDDVYHGPEVDRSFRWRLSRLCGSDIAGCITTGKTYFGDSLASFTPTTRQEDDLGTIAVSPVIDAQEYMVYGSGFQPSTDPWTSGYSGCRAFSFDGEPDIEPLYAVDLNGRRKTWALFEGSRSFGALCPRREDSLLRRSRGRPSTAEDTSIRESPIKFSRHHAPAHNPRMPHVWQIDIEERLRDHGILRAIFFDGKSLGFSIDTYQDQSEDFQGTELYILDF